VDGRPENISVPNTTVNRQGFTASGYGISGFCGEAAPGPNASLFEQERLPGFHGGPWIKIENAWIRQRCRTLLACEFDGEGLEKRGGLSKVFNGNSDSGEFQVGFQAAAFGPHEAKFVDHQGRDRDSHYGFGGNFGSLRTLLSSSDRVTQERSLGRHMSGLGVNLRKGSIQQARLSEIYERLRHYPKKLQERADGDSKCQPYVPSIGTLVFSVFAGFFGSFFIAMYGVFLYDKRRRLGTSLIALGCAGGCASIAWFVIGARWNADQYQADQQPCFQHNAENVSQKTLTPDNLRITLNTAGQDMANVLDTDKKIAVIAALAEGSSIRSIERMTGIHRDTIMRLGVRIGQGCTILMHEKMRDLPCTRLEMDEIWGFVGKKERNVREGESGVGSVWTFCAIDADTKLVPAFKVGDRDAKTATAFMQSVAMRMRNRVQISTDGLRAYVEAVEKSFGADVDYAQIVKTYGHEEASDNRRYRAPEFVSSEKKVVTGRPNYDLISTSYVERLNATTRLHMRRLTRLTLAFSKKRENFEAAVGLHFAYYNFVKRHNTLRCTPAMAAGVAQSFWTVGDLVEAAA
jgi:IS1 family transposase